MAAVIWNAGAPPKRGAYRVKSDGPSANVGWRYWHGARWSGLSSTRAWCIKASKDGPGRNSRIIYPIMWASPAPAPESRLTADLIGKIAEENSDEFGLLPIAFARAIERHITPSKA